MKIKLALAQFTARPLDVEFNRGRAREMIEAAARKGCDLVCLPELFLTGPVVADLNAYAQPVPGPHTDFFGRLAKVQGIHIAMGSINEKAGSDYFNTSVLLDDAGQLIGTYRKHFLWNGEKKTICPGSALPVFTTRFGKIGLQICWDLAFPELARTLAQQEARLIINAALWTRQDKYDNIAHKPVALQAALPDLDTETRLVNACVEARALENGLVYAFVNSTGTFALKGQRRDALGNSQIAVPFYGRVAALEEGEGLLVHEVDLSLADLAEAVYEIRQDSRSRAAARAARGFSDCL